MTIEIEPTIFRVPGKGDVTINQLDVRVASYSLGVSATSFYDLQSFENVPATRSVTNSNGNVIQEQYQEKKVTSYGLVGNCPLTQEQFNNWSTDDKYFAECIAENLGLVPVTPA